MIARIKHDRIFLPDEAVDHIQGLVTAPVTVIEYGDFECLACYQAYNSLKIMLAHFGPQVCFVFRHYPLRELHPNAELAAEGAEAAGAQGQFWPMYELLFTHQQFLKEKHLLDYAVQLGMDLARFRNELTDHVYLQRVQENMQGGAHLGVRSTPAFYVNGVFADVSFGFEHLHQAIDLALQSTR